MLEQNNVFLALINTLETWQLQSCHASDSKAVPSFFKKMLIYRYCMKTHTPQSPPKKARRLVTGWSGSVLRETLG
jgi:hypothetical protein